MYALLVFLLVVVEGCSSRSDPAHARSALRSWTATARMTAEAWLDRAVPDRYARRTLDLAARRIDETRAHGGSGDERATDLARAAARMRDAVAAGDAVAVRAALAGVRTGSPPPPSGAGPS